MCADEPRGSCSSCCRLSPVFGTMVVPIVDWDGHQQLQALEIMGVAIASVAALLVIAHLSASARRFRHLPSPAEGSGSLLGQMPWLLSPRHHRKLLEWSEECGPIYVIRLSVYRPSRPPVDDPDPLPTARAARATPSMPRATPCTPMHAACGIAWSSLLLRKAPTASCASSQTGTRLA